MASGIVGHNQPPARRRRRVNGNSKDIRPVTIATYQILTHRQSKASNVTHFRIFDERNWGLIIYDEVHLLPAPVFQITAALQARRRLGLTATLVREDHREDEVFALIGPKKYDVPWKVMEKQGWIAKAVCTEIRLPMSAARRMEYAIAEPRHKFRIASENPDKLRIVRQLLERHPDDSVLIIGTFLDQIDGFADELQLPLLKGSTSQRWLRQSPEDRLHDLLLTFHGRRKAEQNDDELCKFLPGQSRLVSTQPGSQALRRLLERIWSEAAGESLFPLAEFIAFHARESHPRKHPELSGFTVLDGTGYGPRPLDDLKVEELWGEALKDFFWKRLVPLGAVDTGFDSNQRLCFRLNSVGNFLLGRVDQMAAARSSKGKGLIVQPNFEIVFLQPNASAEVDLSLFAERLGKGYRAESIEPSSRKALAELGLFLGSPTKNNPDIESYSANY